MYKLPLFFLVSIFSYTVQAQQIILNVKKAVPANSPINVTVSRPDQKNAFALYQASTKKSYPLQWYDQGHAIFILTDSIPAGSNITFDIKKINSPTSPFGNIKTAAGIEIRVKDKPVFYYHTAIVNPPADSPSYYKRSGFIHPLYSPAGTVMTDDFPSSHAHQHGVFHAWTNTTYKKQHVDFWNQHQLTGTVQHKEVVSMTEGPVFTELKTVQEYVSLKFGVVLTENWTIRVYPFADKFMFDLHIEQTNITADTLFLNKYIYGGMAFRGTREWDPFNKKYFRNNWHILTSEGLKDTFANHTSARWVTAFGDINGSMSAATVFNHSSNTRYPQKIRVHPDMPYWVYSPVVDGDLFIAPGGKYLADYRYFISNTVPDNISLERIHETWIHPPEMTVGKK